MPFHGTIWYRRKKYYKIHKCKQKIEDREVLMFIYVSYLKEIKQHMRVWPKYTFISIWSQYLLIQIRKWIYVTTFKTTFFTKMNRGGMVRLRGKSILSYFRKRKHHYTYKNRILCSFLFIRNGKPHQSTQSNNTSIWLFRTHLDDIKLHKIKFINVNLFLPNDNLSFPRTHELI